MAGTLDRWRRLIGAMAQGGAPATAEVAEAAIALLAMPYFQFTHVGHVRPAPSLVMLGEDDGRLYGALVSCDPTITQVFGSGRAEPYAVMGGGMTVLMRDEVSVLHDIATRTKVSGHAEVVRAGLLTLLEWSLVPQERAVAVSYEA